MDSVTRLPLITRIPTDLYIGSPKHMTYATEPKPAMIPKKKKKGYSKLLKPSRNEQRGSMPYYNGPVGPMAKLEYIDSYKSLPQLSERNNFRHLEDTPTLAYLNVIEKERLSPQPFGIIRRAGSDKIIDVPHRGMGDKYADAFSEGLKHVKSLEVLNLKENRLSEKGTFQILKNLEYKDTKRLDLSGNRIGESSIAKISDLLTDENPTLKHLNLENCKIGNKAIITLCKCIADNRTLTRINLAKNNIGDSSCQALEEMLLYNQNLRFLDLHWNKISGTGVVKIFRGIEMNEGLRYCDLSWNAIGNNPKSPAAEAIGKSLKENVVLAHLDLSYNDISKQECEIINQYLKHNHTLIGLHMEGNHCKVNSLGFLVDENINENALQSHFFQRVIGNKVFINHSESSPNCWICEQWKEMVFIYKPENGNYEDLVFINLEIDEYRPDIMKKQDNGSFTIKRAVPPGKIHFFFSTLQGPFKSSNYAKKILSYPVKINILKNSYTISQINIAMAEGPTCTRRGFFETKPRIARTEYEKPDQEFDRIIWKIPISLFKDYHFDTNDTWNDGFEFDYKHTRIPNFVKKLADQEHVKSILKAIYQSFREFYKYFSATGGGEIFCIGPNGMSEFLNMCNIIDELYDVTDIGVNWNAIKSQVHKDQIYNAKNGICRYEFMEILVRIANDKYIRNKVCSTVGDAIEKLAQTHLIPVFSKYDSNKWRYEKYLVEDVDLALKVHKMILDAIFKKYSGKKTLPGKKPFVSVEEFRTLCADAQFIREGFTTRESDICYSLSMMTQVDDLYKNKHLEMCYVEFLEAVCRAIDWANLPKIDEEGNAVDTKSFALKAKIENSMIYLLKLCPQQVKDSFVPPTEETYFKLMYKPQSPKF
ncbi:unnamed protein product [Blepharisma stoltei]|uniref:Uncharacterized protein n=1 Tax=Blepharisma stoltei TaxID=1481888 RepID=A0AAU9KC32_9CILI|nr:unnamed protein product [Blepharisma stoltei]